MIPGTKTLEKVDMGGTVYIKQTKISYTLFEKYQKEHDEIQGIIDMVTK